MKFNEINEEHLFDEKDVHGIEPQNMRKVREKRWEMIVKAQNKAKKEINPDFPWDKKNNKGS